MINVLILEDEVIYADLINSLLEENFPDFIRKGIAGSVDDGIKLIRETNPDILICDIELSDGTSFDLLRRLENIPFQIIFITAHNEFAVEAFRFCAVDYLLKPVQESEFRIAVNKAIERLNQKELQHIRLMLENLDKSNDTKRLVLRAAEQIHIVNINEIVRCKADNAYTTFFLTNNESILVSKGLKDYEELLCNNGFFKVHQSHIVNLQYLRKIDKVSDEVVLSDRTRIPLSSRRKQPLLQILNGN